MYLQALQNEVAKGHALLHSIDDKAQDTLASTTAPGKQAIKDKVIEVRDSWNQTVTQMTGEESKLSDRLTGLKEFSGLMEELDDWLKKAEKVLEEIKQPQDGLEGKVQVLDQCKVCSSVKCARDLYSSFEIYVHNHTTVENRR